MGNPLYTFVIDWQPDKGSYHLWSFDPSQSDPLTNPMVQHGNWSSIDKGHKLIPIGKYILDWVPATGGYRLWQFDPHSSDPLPGSPVQEGSWSTIGNGHQLIPIGSYILDWIPTFGRYRLLQFDPQSSNPLPPPGNPVPWGTIDGRHQLIPIGSYILGWVPATGDYRLWQFDPQSSDPLADSPVQAGTWSTIDKGHQLIPIGSYVLDWVPAKGDFRLYSFDPSKSDPLSDLVQKGTWSTIRSGHSLIGVQPLIPIQTSTAPGSMDFMRNNIKHVVYYMLENRSFDHVCGWLYEKSAPSQILGSDSNKEAPFRGASTKYYNPVDQNPDNNIRLSQFKDGHPNVPLNIPHPGPDHSYSGVMTQLYKDPGDPNEKNSYQNQNPPLMMGFVHNYQEWSHDWRAVMQTYTPEQLPVLNGLAGAYAVSDQWFSSMPGPTDVNRAFALTGSSFGRTENFEGGPTYQYWPEFPHRPSIWKVLWANGVKDWKIYYQDDWGSFCYTYQLFLKGQIPTVDQKPDYYVCPLDSFFNDVKNNTLPAFSFIEPAWMDGDGSMKPNSYHPPTDLVPGEEELNKIYNALLESDHWKDTLLIITFDEHGGIYDHVAPPFGTRPYAFDEDDGFKFDLFGVRVPTILISPWVEKGTVFRTTTSVDYDATSMPATVLSWFGIPKERWELGERTNRAPTFEGVFTRTSPRSDKPTFKPPHDENNNPKNMVINDLHRTFVPRLVWHLGHGTLDEQELQQTTDDILKRATNVEELNMLLREFQDRVGTIAK